MKTNGTHGSARRPMTLAAFGREIADALKHEVIHKVEATALLDLLDRMGTDAQEWVDWDAPAEGLDKARMAQRVNACAELRDAIEAAIDPPVKATTQEEVK
jgi:hypothetical protein